MKNSGLIVDFKANETSDLFNFKEKITGQTSNDGTKDVEMMVLLKYQSTQRTLEMPLINCVINLVLIWSENCVISSQTATNQAKAFAISDTKFYFSVGNLIMLLQQLKSGFKRTINWNKYQSKVTI